MESYVRIKLTHRGFAILRILTLLIAHLERSRESNPSCQRHRLVHFHYAKLLMWYSP